MIESLTEPTVLDRLEAEIASGAPVVCPLVHSFTPGIYIRQMFVPAGAAITSRVHRTEHHFVLLRGKIIVRSDTEDRIYEAPCLGITPPNTRRAAIALEDTVWMTIHANPNNELDPDVIAEEISDFPENPLILDRTDDRVNAWKTSVSPSIFIISDSLQLLENKP
jgi:quercetin dioxygenase-like cupin family protein